MIKRQDRDATYAAELPTPWERAANELPEEQLVDRIGDDVECLLLDGHRGTVDAILRRVHVGRLPPKALVCLLTATSLEHPDSLPSRAALFRRIADRIEADLGFAYAAKVLSGLR